MNEVRECPSQQITPPPPEWFCRHVLAPYNRKRELSVAQKKWLDIYLLNEELPGEWPEELEG